jgi:hypothetical protein
VSARGAARQPPSHRAHPGPGGSALQHPAHIHRADRRRPGPDGRPESAEPGVAGPSPRSGLGRREHRPSYRRRLAVSRRGVGSVLARGRRLGHGQPQAGGTRAPGIVHGPLPAAAHGGVAHADRPRQPIGGGQLSAAPDPAPETAQYEPSGQWRGQRRRGELLSDPQNCTHVSGGPSHARAGPDGRA